MLVLGSFVVEASLRAAARGAQAVFSVQLYNPRDAGAEVRQARALIRAAHAAGCPHFVQTSVSGVGGRLHAPGWANGRWDRTYWLNKAEIEAATVAAGFAAHTILRPAFMMENFVAPKAARMFPDLAHGRLVTAIFRDTKLALVAAADIGRAVAAALGAPERFAGATLELCSDWLTLDEIASVLRVAWNCECEIVSCAAEDLIAGGQSPGWVQTQEWLNVAGYPARPDHMIARALKPTPFSDWARAHGARA
jgi:uncharacterized protein YbjT (DUF2867 family)